MTAFLAATATKVAIYRADPLLFLRLRRRDRSSTPCPIAEIIIVLSVAAHVHRLLRRGLRDQSEAHVRLFVSVAQIGYITLGIGLANQAGLTGGHRPHRQPCAHERRAVPAVGAMCYRAGTVRALASLPASAARCRSPRSAFTIAGLA